MNVKYQKSMMQTAITWSEESSCKKRKVGCVIALNNNIASIGFNGTIKGTSNCCEETRAPNTLEECNNSETEICNTCKGMGYTHGVNSSTLNALMGARTQCTNCNGFGQLINTMVTSEYTLHAEANAVKNAHELGIPIKDSVVYVTLAPCKNCAKLLASHQIKALYYKDDYKNTGIEYLKSLGIEVNQLND